MKTIIAISMFMTLSTAFAGTLTGVCKIKKPYRFSETFRFNVPVSKYATFSKYYSVKVPLADAFSDDYSIAVTNTTGLSDIWNANKIEITVGAVRRFCNPPVLQEDGSVSRTKCDRPLGWKTVAGSEKIEYPAVGDTLSFHQETEQVSISCKAILK